MILLMLAGVPSARCGLGVFYRPTRALDGPCAAGYYPYGFPCGSAGRCLIKTEMGRRRRWWTSHRQHRLNTGMGLQRRRRTSHRQHRVKSWSRLESFFPRETLPCRSCSSSVSFYRTQIQHRQYLFPSVSRSTRLRPTRGVLDIDSSKLVRSACEMQLSRRKHRNQAALSFRGF